MAYPVDDAWDRACQAQLALEIAALTEVTVYTSPTTGLRLPIDRLFPAKMLYYFLVGDYEEHDLQFIRRYLKQGDRMLELGGGIGLTGALIGKVTGRPVAVCEPNPALHAQMQQTFAANSSELKLLKVACVAEHETQERVLFHAQSSALLPLQSENSSTVSGLT